MAEPPFPVPKGMQWDPEKRRFFKAPAYAAAVKGGDDDAEARHKVRFGSSSDEACEDAGRQDARLARPSVFAFRSGSAASIARPDLAAKPGRPTSAQVRAHSTGTSLRILRGMRLHSIVTLASYAEIELDAAEETHDRLVEEYLQQTRISKLCSSTTLGALMFFQITSGKCLCVDLARVSDDGRAPIYSTGSGFIGNPCGMKDDDEDPDIQRHAFLAEDADREILLDIQQESFAWPSDMAVTGSHLVHLHCGRYPHLAAGLLSRGSRAIRNYELCHAQPRDTILQDKMLDEFMDCGRCCISARSIPAEESLPEVDGERKCIIAAACDRIIILWTFHQFMLLDPTSFHGAAQVAVKSDVMCHDISSDGSVLLIGCRNGSILACDVDILVTKKEVGNLEMRRTSRVFKGPGAVTNLKCVAENDVLVAFSTGHLQMLTFANGALNVTQEYADHFNRWTLDTPMAVDETHRVFAVAGQDHRVRLWSFDHASPLRPPTPAQPENRGSEAFLLRESKLSGRVDEAYATHLAATVFANRITGLAFVPREIVRKAEGEQNHEFLARGLPALAVSCGDHRIALFE